MRLAGERCLSWNLGHGHWLNVTVESDGQSVHAERVEYGDVIAETRLSLTHETVAKHEQAARGYREVYVRGIASSTAKALDYLRDREMAKPLTPGCVRCERSLDGANHQYACL